MSDGANDIGIRSVAELLAHSVAIEIEAADRYAGLADQMEVANNEEVAGLFRKLAEIEGKHVSRVRALGVDRELPHIAPWDLRWEGTDSPEAPEPDDVHYLMTPYHALRLALRAERGAVDFFSRVAARAADESVRRMAADLAEEEREHVALIEQWIERYPTPDDDWADDDDPPHQPE